MKNDEAAPKGGHDNPGEEISAKCTATVFVVEWVTLLGKTRRSTFPSAHEAHEHAWWLALRVARAGSITVRQIADGSADPTTVPPRQQTTPAGDAVGG